MFHDEYGFDFDDDLEGIDLSYMHRPIGFTVTTQSGDVVKGTTSLFHVLNTPGAFESAISQAFPILLESTNSENYSADNWE